MSLRELDGTVTVIMQCSPTAAEVSGALRALHTEGFSVKTMEGHPINEGNGFVFRVLITADKHVAAKLPIEVSP